MKMLNKEKAKRQATELLFTDMLMSREHFLRKIDAAVGFTHICELVKDLYCEADGCPNSDPVVLFMWVLMQHQFGIRLLWRTMRDVEVNAAYRWLLEYTLCPQNKVLEYATANRDAYWEYKSEGCIY